MVDLIAVDDPLEGKKWKLKNGVSFDLQIGCNKDKRFYAKPNDRRVLDM